MKRIIHTTAWLLVLLTALNIWASAESKNTQYTFETNGVTYTVEFTETSLSEEKQAEVAQRLLGIKDSDAQTNGLGCTLFGHDLTSELVLVITHKVRVYAPRCERKSYEVETCADCDYLNATLLNTDYVFCCPVD